MQGRPPPITTAEDVKVTVPLRISYRRREELRFEANTVGLSMNELLLDVLAKGGLDLR